LDESVAAVLRLVQARRLFTSPLQPLSLTRPSAKDS
jgi:hypothetical protein